MSDFLFTLMIYAIFFGPPLLGLAFFVIALVRFLSLRKKRLASPESVTEEQYKGRRNTLIGASITAGVLVGGCIIIIAWLMMAIAYM